MCPVCGQTIPKQIPSASPEVWLTLSPQRKRNWLWGQYWGKTAAEKTKQVSAHLQHLVQRRLLAGGMNFAVAPSSQEPLLVQRVQRKEVLLVAADLAVVRAGLGILQRSWSVFSSRGENLCECRIDDNKFDWLSVGMRSLLAASGETLKNG